MPPRHLSKRAALFISLDIVKSSTVPSISRGFIPTAKTMAGTTFDLKFLLDNLDLQSFQRSLLATFPFFLAFFAVYHLLCPVYTTSKQLSWILTTVTSAIMTIASLPFLWRYFTSGGSVTSIPALSWLAEAANRLFQAYLIA